MVDLDFLENKITWNNAYMAENVAWTKHILTYFEKIKSDVFVNLQKDEKINS